MLEERFFKIYFSLFSQNRCFIAEITGLQKKSIFSQNIRENTIFLSIQHFEKKPSVLVETLRIL
jgi:hypothetical protein